jgi:hypothetical protein
MAKRVIGWCLAFCAAGIVVTEYAHAQTPATKPRRGETVATRARPEIDPLGIRLGSFFLYPRLTVQQEYDDNIFATENDTEDDFITTIGPDFSLSSDWNRHALNVVGGFNKGIFWDSKNDRENFFDYFAGANGRVDITRDINVEAGGDFAHLHEGRTDPDGQQGREPAVYDRIGAFLNYNHQIGQFATTLLGKYTRYDYEDQVGGVNNDDRDRDVYEAGVRIGYDVNPEYQPFVRLTGNRRIYDDTPDDSGRDRDSYGGEVVGGVALDLGGLVFGDLFVGYLHQVYPDDDDASGLTFGTAVDWNVTPLTTITATVTRSVKETTEAGASSYIATLGGLSVDHELLRNLILNANGAIGNNDYQGGSREDMIYTVGAGVRYLMNRHFYAALNYRFERRSADNDASGPDEDGDYSKNLVRVSLEGQF